MPQNKPKFSLKDQLFNKQKVAYLASCMKNAYPQFNEQQFTTQILQQFPTLELKQRINCIRIQLEKHLPNKFEDALTIILNALPVELNPQKTDNDFGDFIFAPLSDFVAKNGLESQYLNLSFNALAEITKRFSCEDSIRYFINAHPQESWIFMQQMAQSDNYHQRRLASEGSRPKLPWCIGIHTDYQQAISLLDKLYNDKTRYVVRSVANHLNDIAKIDANLVIKTLKKWKKEECKKEEGEEEEWKKEEGEKEGANSKDKQKNKKEFDFLMQHALRTLLKQGNNAALKLLGFNTNPDITINNFTIKNQQIYLNNYLDFSFNITANTNEKLMLDYKIIYPIRNNRKSEKVFKIKKINTQKKTVTPIQKKHLFKIMRTKKLYPGKYKIQLQINGKIFAQNHFQLLP